MCFSSPTRSPQSFHLSLRARLSIGVVATVLATTFATATVALYLVQTHLRSSIADEEFARLSAIGDAIDQKFVSRRTLLRTFANSIESQDLDATATLQAFLDRHGSLNEAFDKVSLLDRSGNLVANLDGGKQNGRVNVSDRPYFIDTVRLRSEVISQPIRNRLNGQPQVVMTEPIIDNHGEVVYVMSGAINLQERNFLGGLADLRFGQTGHLFILNTDGLIISHPQKSRILMPASAEGGRNIPTERALAGFEGTTEGTNQAGVYGLYAFKRITQTNWIVGSIYPASEAFAVIGSLQRTDWAGALLLAALFGGLSLVVLRHYLAPLTKLQDHIRRAEDAASYTPVSPSFARDEIGALALAFDGLMRDRQAAQDSLRASEKHFREVLTHAADAFISVDRHGAITEWNRQAEVTFGWKRSEAIGRSMVALIQPGDYRQIDHPGVASFARTGLGAVVNARMEATVRHRDGREIPVEMSVATVNMGDHYLADTFLRDITGRKQIERDLEKGARRAEASEKQLRAVTDNLPVLITYIADDERVRFMNATFHEWVGVDLAQALGKPLSEVLGPTLYGQRRDQLQRALAGERVEFEVESLAAGTKRSMNTIYTPDIRPDGSVAGVFGHQR
jgi:PAS domain S-box-containing protein